MRQGDFAAGVHSTVITTVLREVAKAAGQRLGSKQGTQHDEVRSPTASTRRWCVRLCVCVVVVVGQSRARHGWGQADRSSAHQGTW